MSALIPRDEQEIRTFEAIDEQAKEFIAHSKAYNTVKSYRKDWEHFVA